MKVLVTGGAGYVGINLTASLLELGHSVTIMDNFMYGYSSILHLISNPNLEIISLDIRNIKENDVAAYDIIYHLAGISGVPACASNPHSAEFINVEATRRLVNSMGKGQLLINASTTSFYGSSGKAFNEVMPVEPISIYGQTKYAAETIVQQRENSVSLRFATIFGVSSRMRNDLLVNDFVYKAMNEKAIILFAGHSKRTFIHMSDAVAAYTFVLDTIKVMNGNIYNVGSARLNFSKLEIAEAIKKYVSFDIIDSSIPTDDTRNFFVSFNKIKKVGYTAVHNLDDGISELIKLYRFYKIIPHWNVI